MSQSRWWWIRICLLATMFISVRTFGQEDTGVQNEVLIFLNSVRNSATDAGVPLTLAELSGQENLVYGAARTGVMDSKEAATKLYDLGRMYWEATEYDNALRVLEKATEVAPKSFAAGQAWILIGSTYYGNLVQPERSIEPFQEAEKVLSHLAADAKTMEVEESRRTIYRLQGLLAGRLAFAHSVAGESERSAECYRRLLETPELAEAANPTWLLEANRQLADAAVKAGDQKAAGRYSLAADEILAKAPLHRDLKIGLQLESINRRFPNPDDPKRLKELQAIWDDPANEASVAVLRVGHELCLVWYFASPQEKAKLKSLFSEFFSRVKTIREISDAAVQLTEKSAYVNMTLLAISFCSQQKIKGVNPDEVVKAFKKEIADRDLIISISPTQSNVRRETIAGVLRQIYLEHFPEHAAAREIRSLLPSSSTDKAASRTPAAPVVIRPQ
ncbi:MAG: hypothetical protein KDA85_16535 [Planctomycetaceae bacterium]|nr:hypothetical protein [Planctomycetaceae bacterium]